MTIAWEERMRKLLLAAAVLAVAIAPAAAEQFINILTGGTSGVYYPLGVALSNIYAKAIPDAKASVQATKASVENLNLLQAGRGEIAFALGDSVSLAWAGNADAGFAAKLDKLRGVAGIYPNYIQIVASADANIRTLADLKGKRISVGAPKSGTELNARAVLGAAGVSYKDFDKVEYLAFAESVDLMKNRQLDATLQSAGLGVSSIRDLANSIAIAIVPIPAELVRKINDPAYAPAVIPGGTYQGQSEDVPTVSIGNFLVTRSGVSEDLVYQMTKSMFENLDALVAAHVAAKAIKLENALTGMPIPVHPGAARFYREKGMTP
jgi:TRAP transporter TAXI family solute receptor